MSVTGKILWVLEIRNIFENTVVICYKLLSLDGRVIATRDGGAIERTPKARGGQHAPC
jgi:hypothetical protein